MNRPLRELSERIRFIEGFDVEISLKKGRSTPVNLGRYEFSRAASRKWTIEYWQQKRNTWNFLEFNIRDENGELLSKHTPLDVPRSFYHRQHGYAGESLNLTIECPSDQVAMQLRRELLAVGIDAAYRLEKFLFFKSHYLYWKSPDLRMNFFERNEFHRTLKRYTENLESKVSIELAAGESARYLDECSTDYFYISSFEELR